MQKLWLMAAVFSLAASGQEVTPKAEVFGSYSFLRQGASPGYQPANLEKGFDVSGALNLNRWLGAQLDSSHHWGKQPLTFPAPNGITEANSTVHTLMGGPRLTYRSSSPVTPFASLLVGGARIYTGYGTPGTPAPPPVTPGSPGTPSAPGSPGYVAPGSAAVAGYERQTNTVFAWGIGGGLDVTLTKRIAYRLVEANYLMTRQDGFSGKGIHNLRLSTGIAIRLGSQNR